jgi:hypothetical protein
MNTLSSPVSKTCSVLDCHCSSSRTKVSKEHHGQTVEALGLLPFIRITKPSAYILVLVDQMRLLNGCLIAFLIKLKIDILVFLLSVCHHIQERRKRPHTRLLNVLLLFIAVLE